MEYKRNEGFRIEFNPPLSGTFTIERLGEKQLHSKEGSLLIYDLSPKGAKGASSLDIPLYKGEIEVKLSFGLNDQQFVIFGRLVWQNEVNRQFYYGIVFDEETYSSADLLSELKQYVRNQPRKMDNV